jgi:hypothetical protein
MLPHARARYYSTALDARGVRVNAPIGPSGNANGNNRPEAVLSHRQLSGTAIAMVLLSISPPNLRLAGSPLECTMFLLQKRAAWFLKVDVIGV